ncbi:hypothetical protein Hanom_Chr06g00502811 [Helianthus anomalus]
MPEQVARPKDSSLPSELTLGLLSPDTHPFGFVSNPIRSVVGVENLPNSHFLLISLSVPSYPKTSGKLLFGTTFFGISSD